MTFNTLDRVSRQTERVGCLQGVVSTQVALLRQYRSKGSPVKDWEKFNWQMQALRMAYEKCKELYPKD